MRKQPHQDKKEHEQHQDASLEKIYRDEQGQLPDLEQLIKRPSSLFVQWLKRGLLLVIVLGILGVCGWFLSRQSWFETGAYLTVDLAPNTIVRSGEPFTLVVNYRNDARVPLAQLEATLTPPIGFELLDTLPARIDQTSTTWNLGTLSHGSDGRIEITGLLKADVPSTGRLQMLFTYRPGNFSSDFQTVKTAELSIEDSVLSTRISGPDKAVVGEEVTYTIDLIHAGETPLTEAVVQILPPKNFLTQKQIPEGSQEEPGIWTIEALEPGTITSIEVSGIYSSSASEAQHWDAVSFLQEENRRAKQSSARTQTDVIGGDLQLSLIANGSSERALLRVGDTLNISLGLENTGEAVVEDLELALEINPETGALPIDWAAAKLAGATRNKGTLTWNKQAQESYARIEPNETRTLDLILPILPISSFDPKTAADAFTLTLRAGSARIGTTQTTQKLSTSPLNVRLTSDLVAKTHARYYSSDGTAIGSGPLPPRVGETTTYHIVWDLSNRLHPLSDLVMSANLPADVTWLDQKETPIGALTFNSTTRTINWTIPRLEIPNARAVFNLSITPQERDINAFMRLLNTTSLSAHDTVTNTSITRSLEAVTTELPDDEKATGRGVVVPSL